MLIKDGEYGKHYLLSFNILDIMSMLACKWYAGALRTTLLDTAK